MSDLFSSPDADLIIRTADAVQLKVFRRILSEASPFFSDLLSLPQPAVDEQDTLHAPVVDVPESAQTMTTLLRLVWPNTDPAIASLDELAVVLCVAVKYDMVRAVATLRRLLVAPAFLAAAPTRVYAIACRHELADEARIASRATLAVNVLDCPLSDDLKHITAYDYHRLLDLHRRRAAAAQALLLVADDVKCMQCSANHYGALSPPKWWTCFEEFAKEELRVRPTTEVIFSMGFLAKSAHNGCQRCAGSILESHAFLAGLKKRIDDLPDTI